MSLTAQAFAKAFFYPVGLKPVDNFMDQALCAEILTASISLMDMRKNARAYGSFPVRMRGVDESGCEFNMNSLVDNISSGGLYMQLGRPVAAGSRLFTVVQLLSDSAIAARGIVSRVERRPHGLSGVAVRFTRTRLLASPDLQAGKSAKE